MGLVRDLLASDDELDVVLVGSPVLIASPPGWPLVLADQTEMLASRAHGRALVALLPS